MTLNAKQVREALTQTPILHSNPGCEAALRQLDEAMRLLNDLHRAFCRQEVNDLEHCEQCRFAERIRAYFEEEE